MKELVSVVVLSYKNVQGVYDTVDSVLRQDYDNIEIIISDDGTPDFEEYEKELKRYIDKRKHSNISNVIFNALPENVGTVRNINSAIKLANGKFIKLIASEDCFNSASAISKYVDFMEQNNFKIVFAKMRGVTKEGQYRYVLASCESNYDLLKSLNQKQTLNRLFRRDFLPAPASFMDVKLFEEYGLFPEDVRLIEDYPYWIYLTMNNVQFGYIDEVLIDYKLSGSGSGIYSEAFMKDMMVIYQKYIFPYDNRFGIFQRFYNALKQAGLNFYMSQAQWPKMSRNKRIIASIKYLPFYIFVKLQNVKTELNNIKSKK